MDSSTSSFGSQSAPSSVQRKFYQWVLRWISEMKQTNTESNDDSKQNSQSRLDVPIIASFFQAIGFKLLLLHSDNDAQRKEETGSTIQPGILKVTIECGTSKMKAILNLEDVTCRCPNSDHVNDASFWSISGTAPLGSTDNIARNVEETGSNLLPPLPKDVTRVLRDVSQRLFELIIPEPDVNRNTDTGFNVSCSSTASNDTFTKGNLQKEIGVRRSYTPEICLHNSKRFSINEEGNDIPSSISQNASQSQPKTPVLQRHRTWDIDIDIRSVEGEPRPSPPKITSSPTVLNELSQSLGQLSIAEEANLKNLTEYIMGAKINLEKVLNMLTEVASIDASINQDDRASVKSASAKISPAAIGTAMKQTRLNTISGVKLKPLSSSNHFTKERQALVKPTPRNSLQTSRTLRTSNRIAPSLTRRSMQSDQENVEPPLRRRSFDISSSSSKLSLPSKPIDIEQKLPNDGKYDVTKLTATPESNLLNESLTMTKTVSPTKILDSSGRISMFKSPAKVSKAIPVIIKPVQRIAKGRRNLSIE